MTVPVTDFLVRPATLDGSKVQINLPQKFAALLRRELFFGSIDNVDDLSIVFEFGCVYAAGFGLGRSLILTLRDFRVLLVIHVQELKKCLMWKT